MEVNFSADQIAGIAVMMNNGTVPFLGLATILPQGVENVYKWKPSFLFDKVIEDAKDNFKQMGILESYEFTNLTYTMLKARYQISISNGDSDELIESIFLADNNTAGKMVFLPDGKYQMSDGFKQKELVDEFSQKAKDGGYTVYMREKTARPVKIDASDIEEVFNLMHI